LEAKVLDERESVGGTAIAERAKCRLPAAVRPASTPVPRQVLGLVVLVLTLGPAWTTFRAPAAPAVGSALGDMAADEESDEDTDESVATAVTMPEIKVHIREVAARHGLSPRLVAAIIEAESEFNPRAVSRRGARGLMQLMPATAQSLDVADSFDPLENIDGGVRHLRRLMDRFHGNLPLVLAAYNAGEGTVTSYGGIPPYPETRRYVRKILRRIGYRPLAASTRARPAVLRVSGRPPAASVAIVEASMTPRSAYAAWRVQEASPSSAAEAPRPGRQTPPRGARKFEAQGP
jgi:hypothetical protein